MSISTEKKEGESEEEAIRELIEFADSYQSNDFPNPEREGCPDGSVLRKAAYSKTLIEESVREHILVCSPCFLAFKAARENPPWISLPKVMVAGMSVFILVAALVIATIFLKGDSLESPEDIARIDQTFGTQIEPSQIQEERESERGKFNQVQDNDKTTTKSIPIARFNSETERVDRGGISRTERRPVPSEKVVIEVRLTTGSPAGIYRIGILDEFGRELSSEIRVRSDGNDVRTLMDLTGLKGPARLCIGAGDEVPECFPVTIR